MNRPSKITAANPLGGSPASSLPSGAGDIYSFRTTDCEYCDYGCDECVRGEVDAACADCGNVYPLNDDGVCEYCADASELSIPAFHAKWLCPHVKAVGGRVEL